MSIDLNQVHQAVSSVIKQTNKLALNHFYHGIKANYKSADNFSTAIVTQADKQIEELIKNALKKKFPHIGFIGEESSQTDIQDYNWIVDPIDGTMNFAHRIPLFGTSIALWHHNQPVYGLISLPTQNEIIHAIKDQGVYLNNKKLTFKHKPKPLNHSFVFIAAGITNQNRLKYLSKFIEIVPYPRGYACLVFKAAYTALRRVDALVIIKLSLWDIAAAILIAQEAGLACQFITPQPDIKASNLTEYQHTLVIGQPKLVNQLAAKIKQVKES